MQKCAVIGAFGNYGGVAACIASRSYQVQIVQDTQDLHPVRTLRRADPHPYQKLLDSFNREPRLRVAHRTSDGDAFEEFRFAPATSDYAAVADADVLLLAVPSLFHEPIGARLRNVKWKRALTVMTFTDRSLGAYACWHAAGEPEAWRLVGLNATPYLAQKNHLPFTFRLLGPKMSVLVANYPRGTEDEVPSTLKALLPGYAEFCLLPNMLDLAMSSNPAVLHAIHELSIIEKILTGQRVPMYDASYFDSDVVAGIIEVCSERMRIAEAYGVTAQSYMTYEKSVYTSSQWQFDTILENRNNNPLFRPMLSPVELRQAKGIESVCCSFCLWESMGRHAGMELHAIPKVIDEWSKRCQTDLRCNGRDLRSLGLGGYAAHELAEVFR